MRIRRTPAPGPHAIAPERPRGYENSADDNRDTYDLEPFGELIDQGVYLLSRHASPLVFLRRLREIVWSYGAKQIGNYAASRRLCLTTLPEFRMDVYGLASTMTVA